MFSCCCSHDSRSENARLLRSQSTMQQKKPSQQAKPSPNAEKCYRVAMQHLQNNNLKEAFDKFEEARNAGHPKAFAELLKVTYLMAMRCKKIADYVKAFGMFEGAATGLQGPDDGYPDAQFELGMCYLTGQGVEQDKDQARIWFTHAANNGHHLAPKTLKIMSADPSKGITLEIGDNGIDVWN
jgi:TPR repeat protein